MTVRSFAAFCLATCLSIGAAHAQNAQVPQSPLHRGINIIGYDPLWKDPSKARFKEKHFSAIRDAGFDFVRVNLAAFRHMDAQNRIDPKWLATLDWVVKGATAAGLSVILDEHDFNECAQDVDVCRVKLTAFWTQVAPRYSASSDKLLFELLNEPHDKLDAENWNDLAADVLKTVRQSNPKRLIVIGPTRWNNFEELPNLKLPEDDRNILVTFHYYEPFRFTHQGASWTDLTNVKGVTWGSDQDRERIKTDFDKVSAWAQATNRPVLLGEFGAYDKSGTPMEYRAAYTGAVAREAERHGFSWAYWQFDSDFVAYDISKDEWVAPIRDALIPR